MIIVFTSNTNGGIAQLCIHLLKEFSEMNYKTVCFLPKETTVTIPDKLKPNLFRYDKLKTLNIHSSNIRNIKKKIEDLFPELIIYVDTGIISSLVALSLAGKVKQIMTFHDAGAYHPSNNLSIKNRIRTFIQHNFSRLAAQKINNVMVLSHESEYNFKHVFPESAEKTILVPLGAHIPDTEAEKPPELIPNDFFLFFGRIDKYKGIDRLLEVYTNINSKEIPLVIAGQGHLSKSELYTCKAKNVFLLNRYISDSEMIWLFKHSKFVILPYNQATQSGIIPIAYSYGIPVITSDASGLTQFVVNGKTGYICSSVSEYKDAIEKMWNMNLKNMSVSCKKYYDLHLNWKTNLQVLLNRMGI